MSRVDPAVLDEMRKQLANPESLVQSINGIPRSMWAACLQPVCEYHRLSDHQWAYDYERCTVCGISKKDFYNVSYGRGLPCQKL